MLKIFPIIFGVIIIFSSLSQAEVKQFTAQGFCVMEKHVPIDIARRRASMEALADISRQAAAAIRAHSVSENNQLTEEVLKMTTSSVIKVVEQKFDLEMTSDDKPKVIATVTATVDMDKAKKLSADLMNKTDGKTKNEKIPAENLTTPVGWWENDILTAQGFGISPSRETNSEQKKYLARQAALMDGYRNLAAQAAGIHITAKQTMIEVEIDAVISGVKIISESYDEQGNCTVALEVPVYGVSNSIAKNVFKPVAKKDFPQATEEISVAGNYTGLIIDCGDLELNPVLLPTIQNSESETIYGYENLDYEKVVERGMIGYTNKPEKNLTALNYFLSTAYAANNSSRAGNNPLVIKASALTEKNTCPVVSKSDANKILAENQASHFLDNGAVVFLSNDRILGGRF